jgi:predicted secreted protein
MMSRLGRWSLVLLASVLSVAALGDAEPGKVELQTTATARIETDRMEVRMVADRESSDPTQLAREVNDATAWALKQAQAYPHVTASGGVYSSYPVYKKEIISHWRGVQQLVLASRDPAQLGQLVGRLQEKLLVQGIEYKLSEAKRVEAENQLIERALGLFEQRASLIQTSVGARTYRLRELNVQTERPPVQPRYLQSAAASVPQRDTAAQLTPAYRELRVVVAGTIILLTGPSGETRAAPASKPERRPDSKQ